MDTEIPNVSGSCVVFHKFQAPCFAFRIGVERRISSSTLLLHAFLIAGFRFIFIRMVC